VIESITGARFAHDTPEQHGWHVRGGEQQRPGSWLSATTTSPGLAVQGVSGRARRARRR
jgi:hypothetical protein